MFWSRVTLFRFILFSIGVVLLGIEELRSPFGWVPVLDGANLIFHEAGHPIFGLLGEAPGLYGGTIGQLVFPLVVSLNFWRQRASMSLAIGCVWFFQNFFNIARYAADAREQILPLVGGGSHDWWNILTRWGILEHDKTVALIITLLGISGIALTWLWTAWMLVVGINAEKNAFEPRMDTNIHE